MFPLPSKPFAASFPHLTNLSSPPQLSVSVDGIHSKKGTTAGPFSQLSSSRLHLGGADVPALLPGAETRSNFVGCMKKVRKSGLLLSRANTYASFTFLSLPCSSPLPFFPHLFVSGSLVLVLVSLATSVSLSLLLFQCLRVSFCLSPSVYSDLGLCVSLQPFSCHPVSFSVSFSSLEYF